MLKKHGGILHKICFLYSNNKHEYDDLYQEIVYQLWKSLPGFKGNCKISTWIYKVALFTALAQLRVKPKEKLFDGQVQSNSGDDDNHDDWEEIELAIKKLNKTDRGLVLLYLENKPYKEMAEIIGISESNVGVRINRIKSKLKKLIHDAR